MGLGKVLTTLLYKTLMLRNIHRWDACSGDKNNLEVNYPTTRISGGGSISRGSTAQQAKRDVNRDLEC